MSNNKEVRNGETYIINETEVKVIQIKEQINAVHQNSVEKTIYIKYTPEVDSNFHTDTSIRTDTYEDFLDKIGVEVDEGAIDGEDKPTVSNAIDLMKSVNTTIRALDQARKEIEDMKSKKDKNNNDN